MKKSCTAAWILAALLSAVANAQVTTTDEVGPDGVKYRVTKQVVQRSVPVTEYQARQQKVLRPQVTTEYQTYQQNYLVPVTEYRVVPHLRNWWDPFGGAYWTNDVEPVTRWEARPATVQVPVARTKWIEETQTTQVPVTSYRTVPEEYTSRVAINVPPAAPASQVALAPTANTLPAAQSTVGGEQYQSDPPRTASRLASPQTTNPYTR